MALPGAHGPSPRSLLMAIAVGLAEAYLGRTAYPLVTAYPVLGTRFDRVRPSGPEASPMGSRIGSVAHSSQSRTSGEALVGPFPPRLSDTGRGRWFKYVVEPKAPTRLQACPTAVTAMVVAAWVWLYHELAGDPTRMDLVSRS